MAVRGTIQWLIVVVGVFVAVPALAPAPAFALDVTPLGADGSANGNPTFLLQGDGTPGYGAASRNPYPGWVFVGLTPQFNWEKWGLRKPAFVSGGARGFDPASAPVMVMPRSKGSTGSRARTGASKSPSSAAATSAAATSTAGTSAAGTGGSVGSGSNVAGASSSTGSYTGPYTGSAPATGEVSGTGTASGAATGANGNGAGNGVRASGGTGEVVYPFAPGVTHTRAASATQTDSMLSNRSAAPLVKPGAGVVDYPAPQTARANAANARGGSIVLPPNNGTGALEGVGRVN